MTKIVELLLENQVSTKRDLYYQNVNLFDSQGFLDQAIEDISCSLGVSRDELNIIASGKGLVIGPIRITLKSQQVLLCTTPTLIPTPSQISNIEVMGSRLLVIEKDATFQSLISNDFIAKCPGIVLVTGKGYPDVATRSLVTMISTELTNDSFWSDTFPNSTSNLDQFWENSITDRNNTSTAILVDGDPDGIEIMLCYTVGSKVISCLL
jgi:meiotic recombination protein SPO11